MSVLSSGKDGEGGGLYRALGRLKQHNQLQSEDGNDSHEQLSCHNCLRI